MINKRIYTSCLIIFFFFTAFYSLRVLPSVFGADSGELLAVMKVLGVAHPPGYPLYTILGNLFLRIPFGEPAFRVGILSVLSSSLSLVFLYLSSYLISKSLISSLLSVLILGFSYTFSMYSQTVEVFALNNLFASILIFLALLINSKQYKNSYLYVLMFVLGLSLTHHHTIILVFPSLFYILYQKRKVIKNSGYIKSGLILLFGLLPYLYLPWAAKSLPALNWGNPSTLNNFMSVVLRSSYGTFLSVPGNLPGLMERFIQFPTYVVFLLLDFSVFGIILFICGFIYLFKTEKKLFNFLALGFFLTGPLFFFYASFPLYHNYYVGILERFFILSSLFFILFISCGFKSLINLIDNILTKIHLTKNHLFISNIFVTALYLFLIFSLIQQNLSRLNFRNVWLSNNYAYDILKSVDKNSIVFLGGDMPLFSSQYVYYVLGYRNDIKLLPLTRVKEYYVIQKIRKMFPDLLLPGSPSEVTDAALNIIKLNEKKFSIYSTDPLNIGKWYRVGFLYKYISDNKDINNEEIRKDVVLTLNQFNDYQNVSVNLYQTIFFSEILQAYSWTYLNNVTFLLNENFLDESKKYLDFVANSPNLSDENYALLSKQYATYFLKKGACNDSETNIFKYLDLRKNYESDLTYGYSFLEKLAKECFKSEEKLNKYKNLRSSLLQLKDKPLNKL